MALETEWEARFEPNSYGFRPGRSMASQNPQDWEFSLAHLPDDSIQILNHQYLDGMYKMKLRFLSVVSNYV
jgi:hypothetical protein